MFWFTADTHFNHDGIIEYCNRPFRDIEHMNKILTLRWNERVADGDTIFVVGDFKFGAAKHFTDIRKELKGNVVLIRGNHDKNNGVPTCIENIEINTHGKRIFLTHKPEDALMVVERYDLALCGHVHQNWKFQLNLINVGVDVWDFYPVHMKQILKAYELWLKPKQQKEVA